MMLMASASVNKTVFVPPGLNRRAGDLRAEQVEAIRKALQVRRAGYGLLLADDMAMGKTLTSLSIAAVLQVRRILVICPAIAKAHTWVPEIAKWFPGWRILQIDGRNEAELLWDNSEICVHVVNYDVLVNHLDALKRWVPQCVIIDESHYIKNVGYKPFKQTGRSKAITGSQRTWAALQIAETCRKAGGMVIAASGTPMVNRTAELIPQLKAIGALNPVFGSWRSFTETYCGGHYQKIRGKSIWIYDSSTNGSQLNTKLLNSCMLRRTKQQLMPDIQSADPIYKPAPILDEEIMKDYRKAEQDIVAYMVESATIKARNLGQNDRRAAIIAEFKANSAKSLVRLNVMREHIGRAKIPGVQQFTDDLLTKGHSSMHILDQDAQDDQQPFKVIVFAHHRAIVQQLAEYWNCPSIQGNQDQADRRDAVESFQHDDSVRVMVCSIQAAGVSIDLHKGAAAVFAEYHWSPAAHQQAIDRLCRPGRRGIAVPYFLYAPNSIDYVISQLVGSKATKVDQAIDGRQHKDTADSQVREAVFGYLADKAIDQG